VKQIMKLFRFFLPAFVIALGLMVVATGKVDAAQIKSAKVTLGDSRSGQESVSYTFSFLHTSAATIKKFTFDFCKVPSGDVNCGTPVSTGSLTSAVKDSVSVALGDIANWGLSINAKMLTFENSGTVGLAANAAVTVTINGIQNTTLAQACDADTGTDTCYIWIKSYSSDGSTVVDTGVVTYTIVDAVTVTALVDPTFTFVVSGVNAGTVNNGITTSVSSAYNTLPFGSLTANTPKYAAHALYVTTNTQSGYTVDAKMATQMVGVYTTNNIDPFIAPWGTPTTWTEPTGGTPNDNTGWIGANTTDTDVTGWTSSDSPTLKFGGISGTAVIVSQKSSSDNGTVPVYVTYGIEANVFQPSDSYQGTLIYNALPTY